MSKSRYHADTHSRRRLPKTTTEAAPPPLEPVTDRRRTKAVIMTNVSKEYHVSGPKPRFKSASRFLEWFDERKEDYFEAQAQTEQTTVSEMQTETMSELQMVKSGLMEEDDEELARAIRLSMEEMKRERVRDGMAVGALMIHEGLIEEGEDME